MGIFDGGGRPCAHPPACRNKPDTAFGSGGHITQEWRREPMDHDARLRHGLKFVVWNMQWLNDLFAHGDDSVLLPSDMPVRGPSPRGGDAPPTVEQRSNLIASGLTDLDPDIAVVVEGPDSTDKLALLFDTVARGRWQCHVQRSRSPCRPGGPIREAPQCVGLAVRTDTGRLADISFAVFDAEDPATGSFHDATEPFFFDAETGTVEWLRYEHRALYARSGPAPVRRSASWRCT